METKILACRQFTTWRNNLLILRLWASLALKTEILASCAKLRDLSLVVGDCSSVRTYVEGKRGKEKGNEQGIETERKWKSRCGTCRGRLVWSSARNVDEAAFLGIGGERMRKEKRKRKKKGKKGKK